ncbi:STAS domain-containing protein [Fulvimarina sp. MAC8]|uniref:STAS domain-containing protein n=1 Tax=Fulvimarina sp. MAC8 TaxID=3162874 RepID=UPI0032ECF2A8
MTMTQTPAPDDLDLRWIELPPTLDIASAGPLAAQLQAQKGSALAIDASLVERAGTQAIQVLLAASKTWQADNLEFKIAQASKPFVTSLELIGLTIDDFHEEPSGSESDDK